YINGIVITASDVSERIEVEEQRLVIEDILTEQAELLDSIARGVPVSITLQRITQMVEHVLEGSHCAIGVLDPDGAIRQHAAPNLAPAVVAFLDEMASDSEAGRMLRSPASHVLSFSLADVPTSVAEMFAANGYELCRVGAVRAPGSGELLGSLEVFQTATR